VAREDLARVSPMLDAQAAYMTWSDLHLVNGVVTLDRNKTQRPREWPLHPGVVRALSA
jgi:integrase